MNALANKSANILSAPFMPYPPVPGTILAERPNKAVDGVFVCQYDFLKIRSGNSIRGLSGEWIAVL